MNSNSVEIRRTFQDIQSMKWGGKFLVTLLAGDKLRDFMDGLVETNMEDEVLTEHILSACRIFLYNLSTLTLEANDSRTIRFAQTLKYVCEYMIGHGAEFEFLRYFQQILP